MRVIYKLNDDICVGKTYIENDTSVLFDSIVVQLSRQKSKLFIMN